MVLTNLRLAFTSLGLAVGFAAAGRRRGHSSSLLEEAVALLSERQEAIEERRRNRESFLKSVADARLEQQFHEQEAAGLPENAGAIPDEPQGAADTQEGVAPGVATPPPGRLQGRRGIDLDYFEQLSQQSDPPTLPDNQTPPG